MPSCGCFAVPLIRDETDLDHRDSPAAAAGTDPLFTDWGQECRWDRWLTCRREADIPPVDDEGFALLVAKNRRQIENSRPSWLGLRRRRVGVTPVFS